MNTGSVIIIVEICSMNRPRKISMASMPTTMVLADRPEPTMAWTSPLVAPEKLRICENVVAPRMMNRIIAEITSVPCSAANRRRGVSAR